MSIYERMRDRSIDKYEKRSFIVCIVIVIVVVATIATAIGIYASGVRKPDLDAEIIDHGNVSNYQLRRISVDTANVLFITLDDLRPALRCYGDNIAHTPNIDQLAGRGYIFQNAYAQQALCAPSRTSFLTSRRPDSLHLYDENSYWRSNVGNFTSLPQYLKENGFYTVSIGKVFHHGAVSNNTDDYPYSWSEVPYRPSTEAYKMDKVCRSTDGELHMNLFCPVNVSTQPEGTLPDLQNIEAAVRFLKKYAEETKQGVTQAPFFLGLGFYKPHIPFKFPSKYLDLYPLDKIPLAPNRRLPRKLPPVAWNPWTDIRLREDVAKLNVSFPYGYVPEEFQKIIRQGYYASVSYVDDLIGQLLQTLEETGFANNTAIILVGDHGWSLGEHQEWAKYSNFDVATKVPLIVVPVEPAPKPYQHIPVTTNTVPLPVPLSQMPFKYVNNLVELVDLFPTITEMVGLDIPPECPENESGIVFCTEGRSLFPLLQNPESGNWKSAIFSQYPRPSLDPQKNSDSPDLKDIKIMGYTMRTKDYRYTEWAEFNLTTFGANWEHIFERELYVYESDPSEDNNLVNESHYDSLVRKLSKKLREGWRNA